MTNYLCGKDMYNYKHLEVPINFISILGRNETTPALAYIFGCFIDSNFIVNTKSDGSMWFQDRNYWC